MIFENLLRPGKINSMPMRNRFIAGPMEKAMAHLDGTLNERYVAYACERAKGGVALIHLESAYVSPEGRGNPYQVGCHGDHIIPGLTRIADAIHEHGGKLAMELNHGGRQSSSAAHHRRPIGPSSIRSAAMDPGSVPREMTLADIERVTEDFVMAAERCLQAGVDMLYIHGAHGYLLGQFLSPQANKRMDDYGGELENRARFALEVLAAIRRRVGPDYPIGYRLSAVEYIEGGLDIEESTSFVKMLVDGGIDLIDVAGGTYESMSKIFQGAESPRGGFIVEASAIRKAVGDRVPVSVAQRLNDPEFASAIMEKEGFAYITLTRGFHADPQYVQKLVEGKPEEILPCIACNTCVNLTVRRVPAGCSANPLTTYEASRTFQTATVPQRVLVIGGGVAGMHAARFLALQGQDVTLCEATGRLGGQLNACRKMLPDYGKLVDWLSLQLEHLGVRTELGKDVTVDDVHDMDPDVVVVATGAVGGYLWAAKEDLTVPHFDVFSALRRPASAWGGKVAILGGDSVSCFVSKHIRKQGAQVHILEPSAAFATDWHFNGALMESELMADEGAHLHPETTAELLTGDRILIQSRGEPNILRVSAIVIGGRVPNTILSEALQRVDCRATIYTIGDAVRARDLYSAGREAAEVAEKIGLATGAVSRASTATN
ncbi:MAG: FAD-dependent oxidoreductase [Truepera sp.]|nr:FAD-dependent oxidoreductase [Truepera sp.]